MIYVDDLLLEGVHLVNVEFFQYAILCYLQVWDHPIQDTCSCGASSFAVAVAGMAGQL